MRKLGAVFAAGVAALISTSAMAQDATSAISAGNSELSINGFMTYTSDSTILFGGFSYGAFLSDNLLFKIATNMSVSRSTGSDTSYTIGLRPAMSYYFGSEGSTTVPYVTGYLNYTGIKSGSADAYYQYGGGGGFGAKFFLKDNIAFGPEADYEYNKSNFAGSAWEGQFIGKLELSAYF